MAVQGKSGKDKFADLMGFIKSDSAERHVKKGMDLLERKDWEGAKREFEDALIIFQELDAISRAAQMLSFLGLCCFALKQFDQAADYLCKAITLHQKMGDEEGEATGHLGRGDVLLAKGDNEAALRDFQRALDMFVRNQIYDGVTQSYKGMERTYQAMGDKLRAEEAGEMAEAARRRLVNSPM